MKKSLILLTLCTMASTTSCTQNGLKNGVYELSFSTPPDTTYFPLSQIINQSRILIVKNDTVLYKIESNNGNSGFTIGTFGHYFLNLEKHSDNFYKAENDDIKMNITVINDKTVEVETIKGNITGFYSGGAYITHTEVLPPEKQTLIFARELTIEDEEKILREREKIINKIIPENTLSVIRYEGFSRGEIYLMEIHRVPVETKMYPQNSWYGKAQGKGYGDFLYFSFIEGDSWKGSSNYPADYVQQSGFLHIIPEDNVKFKIELWLDFYGHFINGKLHLERKEEYWENVENVEMWSKIVKYYMENSQ